MSFKPNKSQLEALSSQVRDSFNTAEMGFGAAAMVPDIVRCVGTLLTSDADLRQFGARIHTILMYLPNYSEETVDGPIVHFDLAPLVIRAHKSRSLEDLLKQFAPGSILMVDPILLTYYKGPSQPFGVQGEYYRATLPVNSEEHARKVLAELGVKSVPEDIGRVFIEEIARVSVWGTATYTAFERACAVNQVLAEYFSKKTA
jgi:hypothetical protein